MTNALDFITKPPTLDRWEITARTCRDTPQVLVEITVTGWCARKRRALFVHTEIVAPQFEPMKVSDITHHLALVLEQDRPTSHDALTRGLLGEHWDQPELPFD
jgi:hypothetical protein